jgi:hypothetical protein
MARNTQPADEFYVGYAARVPEGIARLVSRAVAALAALAVAVGLTLVFAQQPFARATFEYEQFRNFSGIVESRPYPALLVSQPNAPAEAEGYSRYLLVAPGKHGADSAVGNFSGKPVSLRGSLIYRDGQSMIELLPGSVTAQSSRSAPAAREIELGPVTLTGEIVDSKCYLGVMNPGRTKVHRDCAARCISGGIPPMLVTAEGTYLLAGTDGRALNQEVLNIVGETIEVHGKAFRSGDTLCLKAEPATFRR